MIRGRWRLIGLGLAVLLSLAAAYGPTVPGERPVHQYLFVVDVTRSMNVSDYLVNGEPVSRLEIVRDTLARTLQTLPCDSRVGLALFSGWQTAVLLEPVELCSHRRELDQLVEDLTWRLGWVPQSNVRRGLGHGMVRQGRMEPSPTLVFLTDGDEAPDFGGSGWRGNSPPVENARVMLVGVGSPEASNVPRLDQRDRVAGFLSLPSGAPAVSRLDEEHLRELATMPGFTYLRLETAETMAARLADESHAASYPARYPLAPWLAGSALLLLLALHLPVGRGARRPG